MNTLLLIAHAPLASALRSAALHVFPDAGAAVQALDVQADDAPEDSLARAQAVLATFPRGQCVLVLTDVLGATPCNVARRLMEGAGDSARVRLLAGVNLPLLLRALSYRHEPLEAMLLKAQTGGIQGIVTVPVAAPAPSQPDLTSIE